VLDVEEPDPDTAGEHEQRHLHEQEGRRADQHADGRDDGGEREVGQVRAAPDPGAHVAPGQPRLDHQRPERPDAEQHGRVADQAVREARPARRGLVLRDGHGRDVAGPAALEVAGGRVMDLVAVLPGHEVREDEQPQKGPQALVGLLRRQERAVGAVVEQDVDANEEAGGGHRDREDQQVGHVEQGHHQREEREVGHDRRRDVDEAAPQVGHGVRGQRLLEGCGRRRGRGGDAHRASGWSSRR
jgi:hypothetical protein